jgi:hypothetical protein
MKLWDASVDFFTLVVRAADAEEAKRVAAKEVEEYSMPEELEARVGRVEPTEIPVDGPAEVIINDPS